MATFDIEDLLSLTIESKYFKDPYVVDYNGRLVPRVTVILSKMLEEPGVAEWANYLGYKHQSYKKEMDKICAVGTLVHDQINKFLSGECVNESIRTVGFLSFLEWYNQVSQLGIKVLGLEQSLVSQYYGGTYDALLDIGGKVWLIDFKTSNKVGYKYFLQLSAYRKLLRELQGIEVDGCLVLQVSKYRPVFLEWIADLHYQPHLDYMNTAEKTFCSLVYSYYHSMYLEGRFKNEWPLDCKYLAKK